VWAVESASGSIPYPGLVPSLERGRSYLCVVRGRGPLGQVEGRRSFRVITEQESQRFDEALLEIDKEVREDLRNLVKTYFAISNNRLDMASHFALRYYLSNLDNPFAKQTALGVTRLIDPTYRIERDDENR
jgi:hypothetical protein